MEPEPERETWGKPDPPEPPLVFYGPPSPDPHLLAEHRGDCRVYPWICSRLGYCPPPVGSPPATESRPVQAPRDRFTLTSCRKARDRAKEHGHPIEPHWAASVPVMYTDLVESIGICPPDVNEDGRRVFTLDRIKNKLGYVPGNLRWA